MTPFQRHLAITVVLAGVAGFLGVWVGTQRMGASEPPPMPLRAAVDELTHRGLVGLTSEQKQKIADIEARYAHTRTELRARIAAANVELANALAEEMSFGPLAQESIRHLQDNVGELQKQTVLYVLELRSVLTPQQRTVFDEKVVAALMTQPR